MAELVVIVPSRGRPGAVADLAEAFEATCTADTQLVFAVDVSDPAAVDYGIAVGRAAGRGGGGIGPVLMLTPSDNIEEATMVAALNDAVACALTLARGHPPAAVGFMGDDHRPRTTGWDRAYLDALAARPGITYGDDLFQGERLPTQCAMSTAVVRARGFMALPVLRHLLVDDDWEKLGRLAGCLTYLPGVVVEHMHPAAGKAAADAGYARVNHPDVYARDRAAFDTYWAEYGERDVRLVREALAAVAP